MTFEPITVPGGASSFLDVVRLHEVFPHKVFTVDGRLVGDLGEVLVEPVYELTLLDGVHGHYDAKTPDGKHVEI
jgi:hypothetical protein